MTSHSAIPVRDGMTGRTRLIRRSALVNVPFFSKNEGARKKDVREFGRFVDEQVLDDDAIHRHQCVRNMRGIRVRLGDVFSLDVHALELSGRGRIKHVGNAHTRITAQFGSPQFPRTVGERCRRIRADTR